MERSSGILLHISSLHSNYGIGSMGKAAYEFVDFLKKAGQKFWQVLPLGPTGFGNSPYQSFSSFAGNPYLIDLDMLAEEGLLEDADYKNINWGSDASKVDFAVIYENRLNVLKKAYNHSKNKNLDDFENFEKEKSDWLEDYALFMAVKQYFNEMPLKDWEDNDIKLRKASAIKKYKEQLADEVSFWKFVQYVFFKQWSKLKQYANKNGISIIGDMPIYVSLDSSDIWVDKKNFAVDKDFQPKDVAGCPPDAFSADGQLWGNPLYDWKYLKKTGYQWWIRRVKSTLNLFDYIRIDHFKGFESYFAVPGKDTTAKNGEWRKGPGIDIFNAINKALPDVKIIAEDLGFETPELRQLIAETGYPGMNVLELAFDMGAENRHLPHNHIKNSIVYTGTHDNSTVLGWLNCARQYEKDYATKYCMLEGQKSWVWAIVKTAYASVSDLAIIQFQDILELDDTARMNVPSEVGNNWAWRMKKDDINPEIIQKILDAAGTYGRIKSD